MKVETNYLNLSPRFVKKKRFFKNSKNYEKEFLQMKANTYDNYRPI